MSDRFITPASTEEAGRALYAMLYAEARDTLEAVLATPVTDVRDIARIADHYVGDALDDVTFSALVDALAGSAS